MKFAPFGATWATFGSDPGLRYGFTGQERDGEIGRMHLGVREYDVASGRFSASDVILPGLFAPGTHNPYAYASNSPAAFVDPSGYCGESAEDPCDAGAQPDMTISASRDPFSMSDAGLDVLADQEQNRNPYDNVSGDDVWAQSTLAAAGAPLPGVPIPGVGRVPGGGGPGSGPEIDVHISNGPVEGAGEAAEAAEGAEGAAGGLLGVAGLPFWMTWNLYFGRGGVLNPWPLPNVGTPRPCDDCPTPMVDNPTGPAMSGDSVPPVDDFFNAAEHDKNKRPSNLPKHEKGQSRKKRDYGGEKGDQSRRPPRRPPPGYKGPWPPKGDD